MRQLQRMYNLFLNTEGARLVRGSFFVGVLLFISLFVVEHAFAAKILFSPASGSYPVGQNFTVQMMIDPEGDGVNSSEGSLTFDSSKLQVVNVSKDGSAFNLWIEEPSASGSTIKFSGGGTTPMSSQRKIIGITFKGRAEGSAAVSVQNAKILAGAGQDVTGTHSGATYTIAAAAPAPTPTPEPTPAATTPRGGGIKPQPPKKIESSTHDDSDIWYSTTTAKFAWDVPYGITGVRTLTSSSSSDTPTETHSPPIAEETVVVDGDGVWYFHLAFQNRNGWGDPKSYKIQVDTTAPEEFDLEVEGGDLQAQLTFKSNDALSGIDEYSIRVDGAEVKTVSPSELSEDGIYTLTGLTPGEHKVKVVAIDMAGNETETDEVQFVVTGTLPGEEEEGEEVSVFGPVYWVSLIFLILLAIVIAMLIYDRKRRAEEYEHIKAEAVEAGERLVNIFDVLREEIEEKVLMMSHKPNMTDNERQILEGLKNSLDIAEELLDKEIEDVRKLVK